MGAYSVRGAAHVQKQLPKQDYVLYRRVNGILIVAVADGLGSHSKSDKGARIACQAVVSAALEFRKGIAGRETAFLNLLMQLWHARIYPDLPNVCGTTCLLAVRFPDGDIFLAQLGDGCLVYELDDSIQILSDEEQEFLNLTKSIGAAMLSDWKYCRLPAVKGDFSLCMHTDGLDIKEESYSYFLHALREETAGLKHDHEISHFLRTLLEQSWEGELDDDRSLAYFRSKKGRSQWQK